MVEFQLPYELDGEFMAKIPAQRQKINEMMESGRISSYTLASDRSKLWCIIKAENEIEVLTTISAFPLIDYMEHTITELMFTNTVAFRLPLFSLN
jgi:muconolactone delta-isomerase